MDNSRQFSEFNLSRGKSLKRINPVARPNFRTKKLKDRPFITQVHSSLINLKLTPTLPLLPSISDTTPYKISKNIQNNNSLDLKATNTSRPSIKQNKHSRNALLRNNNSLNTNLNTPTFYNGFFNTIEVQDAKKIDNTKSVFNAKLRLSLIKPGISSSSKKFLNLHNLPTPPLRKTSINLTHKRIRVLNHPQAKDVFTFNS